MTHDQAAKYNAQISDEAAEWFIEFRTGDIDASGRAAFDGWVRRSPEHLRAYLEFAAIWDETGALDEGRTIDLDTLIALGKADANVVPLQRHVGIQARVSERKPTEYVHAAAQRLRPRWIAAASLAVLAIFVATFFVLNVDRRPIYATDVGEQRSIRLPDGSMLQLNARSRVRIDFSASERAVELFEGQALFKVAKNPARPFIVQSGDARVRAVGTQFDVNRKQGGMTVTVVEGKVAVLPTTPSSGRGVNAAPRSTATGALQLANDVSNADAILITAGEQLTVSRTAETQTARVDVGVATAWTRRQLILESMPLTEAAEEFSRYTTRKLVVEDSAANPLRISGVFDTDPDLLLRYLRERDDITVLETNTEIRILRND